MRGFNNIYENYLDLLKIFRVNHISEMEHTTIPIETEYGTDSIHVYDNVYRNPDKVRDYCSKQIFTKDSLPGVYSVKKDVDVWACDSVVRHLGGNFKYILREISKRYRIFNNDIARTIILKSSVINEPLNVQIHQDLVKPTIEEFFIERDAWQSVIYLNKPEECSGGTTTYMLKRAYDLGYIPGQQKNALKEEDFIETSYTKMKYNRLVTYPGHVWHAAKIEDVDSFKDFYRIVQTFNWRRLV